jgi:hypothetical protein
MNVTFKIQLTNGTRTIPTTVYLGHDSVNLYVGAVFRGISSNPTSGNYSNLFQHSGTQTYIFPEYFQLLLDADHDGILTQPEAGSGVYAGISCPIYHYDCGGNNATYSSGSWAYPYYLGGTIMMWVERSGWFQHPHYWDYGLLYTGSGSESAPFAVTAMTAEYESRSGTWAILYSEQLNYPHAAAIDILQMRPGERWVMGFEMELGYENGTKWSAPPPMDPFQDMVDGWPQNIYPYFSNNASLWPKLVIDLANPPPRI